MDNNKVYEAYLMAKENIVDKNVWMVGLILLTLLWWRD